MLIGGNSPTQGFTDRAEQAAEVAGPGIMLWLNSANPSNATRYPNCVHILRCPNWTTTMSGAAYVASIRSFVQPWVDAIPDIVLQLGNEPDLEAGHSGENIEAIALAVRSVFPTAKMGNPPLSVERTKDANFRGCDVRLVHSYFERQHPEDRGNPQFGGSYLYAVNGAGTSPVYVTEFNVVQTNCPIDWSDRNKQVAQWLDDADGHVDGVCLFILDGQEEWASFDVGPDAMKEILSLRVGPTKTPDYRQFRGLSWAQYQAIIRSGSLSGTVSPMLPRVDYDALIAIMQENNIDPRLPLAFTWSEGHHGTDPGLVAAQFNNLGGIKFSGAPGSFDTGIAADTGGTYAGFYDLRPYYTEWARIMHNSIIGPSFAAGDLIAVVEHFTNGPGTGHNKVEQYDRYVADYDEEPVTPPDSVVTGVSGGAVDDEALTQLGQVWAGNYDTHNGNHLWYLWCQSFVERVHEHVGITGPFYASAATCGRAMVALGRMQQALPAPRGAVNFWDERFWADGGHTNIALGDGSYIGTTEEGIAIGRGWDQSVGYMGWAYRPGVGPHEHTEEIEDVKVADGFSADELRRLWYGTDKPTATERKNFPYNPDFGIETVYGQLANGTFNQGDQDMRGLSVVLGRCLSKEEFDAGTPGRSVRYFERGKITAIQLPNGTYSFKVN